MCVRKSFVCLLATTLMCLLMISVDGASIERSSVSVSVSTSTSESKSEPNSAIEKSRSRSLNSAEIYESKVEISAPYARKVINNFSPEDKSRSLKEKHETTTTKKVEPITTEKPEIESEMTTTELNQPIVTSENIVKKLEFNLNSPIVKESSETATENDQPAITMINETASKKNDAITTVKPENEIESSSIQTSPMELSSTESIPTESSTNESSSEQSNTTESNSTESSSTETTQIDSTSETDKNVARRSLKETNKTDNDQIFFEDQLTSTTTTTTTAKTPVIELVNRFSTGSSKMCKTQSEGDCYADFIQN